MINFVASPKNILSCAPYCVPSHCFIMLLVCMLLSSQAPNTIIYNDINDNKTLIQWRKSHSERGRGAAAATRQTFYAYLHIVSVARIISTKTTVPFCKDHPAIVFRANVCHRVVIVYTILIYKYTLVYL